MRDKPWVASVQTVERAKAERMQRVRALLAGQPKLGAAIHQTMPLQEPRRPLNDQAPQNGPVSSSMIDFSVPNHYANEDLRRFAELFDATLSGPGVHLALFWPHLPPAAVLPWALREVGREPAAKPLRTLFVNLSRSALR